MAIPVPLALELAEDRIRRGLPRLLASHPQDTWAARALAGTTDPPPEYQGVADRLTASAIVSLNRARAATPHPRGCIDELAAAIHATVSSAGWATYGADHPEEYAWYSGAHPRAQRSKRYRTFLRGYWEDAKAFATEQREWATIMSSLAALSARTDAADRT